jgi:hypothetical protein
MIKLQGPGLNSNIQTVDLEVPQCVKLTTDEERKEFKDFVCRLIQAARAAWEEEKR